MKTIKSDKCQVAGDWMKGATRSRHSLPSDCGHLTPPLSPLGAEREKTPVTPHVSRFTFHVSAFTLIELLVVIAIMAALAALLLPVVGAVKKHQYIYNAQAEMAKLETAIDRYKATYGFYPPSPPIPPTAGNPLTLVNQLFYELTGTTNISPAPNPPVYRSLDGSPPTLTDLQVQSAFGVGGFMNCSKPGGGEDASTAKNFLPDLRPKQIFNHTNINTGPQGVNLLTCSVGGPDTTYQPLGLQELNPWRFVCPGINNPGSYDLWIQLRISGKTNLICNWSKQVQIGSPLP